MSAADCIVAPSPHTKAALNVTIGEPSAAIGAQWRDLVCSGGNAFMDPAALKAATESTGARIITLCAWEGERLVGFWALRIRRPLPLLPQQLEALPYDYAFLSTPIIGPGHGPEIMAAFLAAIARDKSLPQALWLKDFEAQGPAFAGLADMPQHRTRTLSRPIVTRDFGVKSSGSTRKKLRQDWNRLCAAGDVQVINLREQAAAMAGLETFFSLESASWKGEQGTALANRQMDALFARQMIDAMAAKGDASVAQLTVDGKAIAAQVLLYCGTTAYTWKISYDAEWAKYSPGMLLVDKLTESLLAGGIDTIDSCALDAGFMGRIWEGRKETIDIVVSPRLRPSIGYRVAASYRQAYEWLRQKRDERRKLKARAAKPGQG